MSSCISDGGLHKVVRVEDRFVCEKCQAYWIPISQDIVVPDFAGLESSA